ncbi:MAG: spermidine synthase [Candidatus Saccharimonadales bacterium]
MNISRRILYETQTSHDTYQVIEEIYISRPSRLLYSYKAKTVQSGIALDNKDLILIEYNQRFVELIDYLKPKEVLLIGGGAFTLPTYITSKNKSIHFDVVEPDEKLTEIASKFFKYKPSRQIDIMNDYGLHFLKKNTKKYDLVIIDAYSGSKIPKEILSKRFAKLTFSCLGRSGVVAANVISDLSRSSEVMTMHQLFSKYFKICKIYPAGPDKLLYFPTNLIYLASNQPLRPKLRYPAIGTDILKSNS